MSRPDGDSPGLQVHRLTQHDGTVNVSRIHGCEGISLFISVRPSDFGDVAQQAAEIYHKLGVLLDEQGASPHDVVTEKIFLRNVQAQSGPFLRARASFYASGNGRSASLPAVTCLRQPPCDPGVLCELQARVVRSGHGAEVDVLDVPGLPAPASGKIISCAGYDHLYLHNLTGGVAGDGWDYGRQTAQMFDLAERVLESQGLTFKDVVRTWIYLDDMERDYAELNRVRSAFFQRVGVTRMPASTGIQGGVYPADRGGALDLYALRTKSPVQVRVMHAPTLNEAWSYGSAFSRGMTVTCQHRTMAYISGTASIDTEGHVVHVGDIEGQVRRMLLNVRELLAGSGATPSDMVRATTYLKNAGDVDLFRRVYAEEGFPLDIPHTICNADVCRPDWLVEIEGGAIFPPMTEE